MSDIMFMNIAIADMFRRSKPFDLIKQAGIMAEHFGHLKSPSNRTRRFSSPRIGNYTAFLRLQHLGSFIHTLRKCRYRLERLTHLRAKHVRAVIRAWDEQGLATRTIQTRLSAIRALFAWLCISHRLPPNRELLPAHRWRTVGVAKRDKTWSGNGWNIHEVVTWIPEAYLWIRYALLLQWAFGLRMKEALLLRPWESDGGDFLIIERGPKGGRRRKVPVETEEQRELLNRVKTFVPIGEAVMGSIEVIPWKTARRRYYRVLHRVLWFTKKNTGVVSHGLRAEYACLLYLRLTGELPPIQGGKPVTRELDVAARTEIAKRLGHNRIGVTSAYVGPMRRQKRKPAIAE